MRRRFGGRHEGSGRASQQVPGWRCMPEVIRAGQAPTASRTQRARKGELAAIGWLGPGSAVSAALVRVSKRLTSRGSGYINRTLMAMLPKEPRSVREDAAVVDAQGITQVGGGASVVRNAASTPRPGRSETVNELAHPFACRPIWRGFPSPGHP